MEQTWRDIPKSHLWSSLTSSGTSSGPSGTSVSLDSLVCQMKVLAKDAFKGLTFQL